MSYDFAVPAVNINGTSREELIRQLIAATEKLREALPALRATRPHPRDYPAGDLIFAEATFLHRLRCSRVEDVIAQLVGLAEAIHDA